MNRISVALMQSFFLSLSSNKVFAPYLLSPKSKDNFELMWRTEFSTQLYEVWRQKIGTIFLHETFFRIDLPYFKVKWQRFLLCNLM